MDKNTNYSTLTLMIIREFRVNKGVHQGLIADRIGKTPSAWTKIENGKSALTFDVLIGACSVLGIHPSQVTALMDKLIPKFTVSKFYFQVGTITEEEDDLLSLISQYFNSKGYQKLKEGNNFEYTSIESFGSPFGFAAEPTIVRYCCEPDYKEWIDGGAEGFSPINNGISRF